MGLITLEHTPFLGLKVAGASHQVSCQVWCPFQSVSLSWTSSAVLSPEGWEHWNHTSHLGFFQMIRTKYENFTSQVLIWYEIELAKWITAVNNRTAMGVSSLWWGERRYIRFSLCTSCLLFSNIACITSRCRKPTIALADFFLPHLPAPPNAYGSSSTARELWLLSTFGKWKKIHLLFCALPHEELAIAVLLPLLHPDALGCSVLQPLLVLVQLNSSEILDPHKVIFQAVWGSEVAWRGEAWESDLLGTH